ncbi:WS/DGAT/MGAT family acyltransferase [Humibacillus xanthopallidus]|uniref:diacylglycerol O-acyltransferase n=1 Tax=Humibacillus xanthopallidus TaxID=412689 RepID=A0A543PVD8_9MICO|nr:wax ester/triacylglycerol synthase domain-containing protein [Humibacillus xanthopallidus]TQN48043.1 WS/DGAT/MGAT family acyltransferase [Humibacillus xanthopallidus]
MPIERVSANDATTLATDRGPAPMNIGVLLRVDRGAELSFDDVRGLLSSRVPLVPRLRQRIETTPPGCGRPIWVDAADFDLRHHLQQTALVEAAGTAEALTATADLVCAPLPGDRPLWAARWVTGFEDGSAALVISAHHCLADGLGGLAVLAALCDEGALGESVSRPFPSPPPRAREVATDAWRARRQALRRLPSRLADTTAGVRELAGAPRRPRLAERTSINRPTGPHRRLTTVETPLDALVAAAHAHGCTVNDLVLCAVAGAVGALLRSRREHVTELVASVPVSERRAASAQRLGNHNGVMALALPLVVDRDERLRRIAALTADRLRAERGTSSVPLGLGFRALARLGAFQPFIDHQRLVHTFVTNVRGPRVPWHVGGRPVTSVVPVAVTPGNVGVSFDVLSYAGRLTVSVVADPAAVPDQDVLTASLAAELAQIGA